MTKDEKGKVFKILLSTAVIMFTIALIILVTNSSKKITDEKDVLSYTEYSNVDYKVYTNGLENDSYLGKNDRYPKDNVSKIVATFNFSFDGNEKLDFEYTEQVKATLYIRNLDGNVIFSKDYELSSETNGQKEAVKGFKVSKLVNIDYPSYVNTVNNQLTLKEIDASDVTSELVVSLDVDASSEISDKDIKSETSTNISIPIGVDDFTITESVIRDNKKITAKVSEIVKNENFITIAYIMFTITIVVLIISLIYYFLNPDAVSTYKSEYHKVRKAVRKYDELITRTYKMPPVKDKKVYELDSFDKFLAIFDKYDLNITMVEKDTYVTFVMAKKDKAWLYSIKKLDK